MIWVFVQVVDVFADAVADIVIEKEREAPFETYGDVEYVEYISFQDVCGCILVIPL